MHESTPDLGVSKLQFQDKLVLGNEEHEAMASTGGSMYSQTHLDCRLLVELLHHLLKVKVFVGDSDRWGSWGSSASAPAPTSSWGATPTAWWAPAAITWGYGS